MGYMAQWYDARVWFGCEVIGKWSFTCASVCIRWLGSIIARFLAFSFSHTGKRINIYAIPFLSLFFVVPSVCLSIFLYPYSFAAIGRMSI